MISSTSHANALRLRDTKKAFSFAAKKMTVERIGRPGGLKPGGVSSD